MTVLENIERLENILNEVEAHPMTRTFIESDTHYTIVFPAAVRGFDGVRVEIKSSKFKALKKMLAKLEIFWKLDCPVMYPELTIADAFKGIEE